MAMENNAPFEIEMFYDSGCPFCKREVAWLRARDRQSRIHFVDINADDFDQVTIGKSRHELMQVLHGRLPSGEWLCGVEVFRRLYAAVGFQWLVAATRWPFISHMLDWAYRRFARYRWQRRQRNACSCSSC